MCKDERKDDGLRLPQPEEPGEVEEERKAKPALTYPPEYVEAVRMQAAETRNPPPPGRDC